MHNGVGLQTARGSGTNGRVQTNRFSINPGNTSGWGPGGSHMPPHPDADGGGMMREPNKEVLEHDRKRQVELELLVLRDALEERDYTEGEVEAPVEEARKAVAAEEAGSGRSAGRSPPPPPGRGFTDTQSHHVTAWKEKQLETLMAAFGLDVEDAKKKRDGESDVESGEIVAGKYYEELDTAGQKDSKDSKPAKKSQKEKGATIYAEVQERTSVQITFIWGKRKTKEEEERDNNKWGSRPGYHSHRGEEEEDKIGRRKRQ